MATTLSIVHGGGGGGGGGGHAVLPPHPPPFGAPIRVRLGGAATLRRLREPLLAPLADAVLTVGGTTLPAHRVVLAAASPVLRAMLAAAVGGDSPASTSTAAAAEHSATTPGEGTTAPADSDGQTPAKFSSAPPGLPPDHPPAVVRGAITEVPLFGVDAAAVALCLDYTYGQPLDALGPTNALAVLHAAVTYAFTEATAAATAYVAASARPDCVLRLSALARSYRLPDLAAACRALLTRRFAAVAASPDWIAAPVGVIEAALGLNDLAVPSEEVVLAAALRWVRSARRAPADAARVLALVRLPTMPEDALVRAAAALGGGEAGGGSIPPEVAAAFPRRLLEALVRRAEARLHAEALGVAAAAAAADAAAAAAVDADAATNAAAVTNVAASAATATTTIPNGGATSIHTEAVVTNAAGATFDPSLIVAAAATARAPRLRFPLVAYRSMRFRGRSPASLTFTASLTGVVADGRRRVRTPARSFGGHRWALWVDFWADEGGGRGGKGEGAALPSASGGDCGKAGSNPPAAGATAPHPRGDSLSIYLCCLPELTDTVDIGVRFRLFVACPSLEPPPPPRSSAAAAAAVSAAGGGGDRRHVRQRPVPAAAAAAAGATGPPKPPPRGPLVGRLPTGKACAYKRFTSPGQAVGFRSVLPMATLLHPDAGWYDAATDTVCVGVTLWTPRGGLNDAPVDGGGGGGAVTAADAEGIGRHDAGTWCADDE
ncbi:hypothetical protein MMPV_006892 [Pyropia vietnamensis]